MSLCQARENSNFPSSKKKFGACEMTVSCCSGNSHSKVVVFSTGQSVAIESGQNFKLLHLTMKCEKRRTELSMATNTV